MMTATGTELSAPVQPRAVAQRLKAMIAAKASARQTIVVRIWPFGLLATQMKERPLELRLPTDATAGDMIDAMAERYGAEFVRQLTPEPGQIARCCRLFADGEPVEELSATLSAGGKAVDIEIIMIMGYEGG